MKKDKGKSNKIRSQEGEMGRGGIHTKNKRGHIHVLSLSINPLNLTYSPQYPIQINNIFAFRLNIEY